MVFFYPGIVSCSGVDDTPLTQESSPKAQHTEGPAYQNVKCEFALIYLKEHGKEISLSDFSMDGAPSMPFTWHTLILFEFGSNPT